MNNSESIQNSVWQCGAPCMSQRHLFKVGERVEVLKEIKDCLGDTLVLRTEEGAQIKIYKPFFKKKFIILKKGAVSR